MEHNPLTALYEQERAHLLAALGALVDGGIVDSIQHIGATSVPGLDGAACVDIGMGAWPYPLEPEAVGALAQLGYHPAGAVEPPTGQRFIHESGNFQLFFVDPGMGARMDWIVLRDYLRSSSAAREEYSARKKAGTSKADRFAQLLPAAKRWWIEQQGFAPLSLATETLKDAPFDWYISGGWALDLFLGRVTRVHQDVDVVVARTAQMELQAHLLERGWKLLTPLEKRLAPWPVHMRLEPPRHQVHAHRGEAFIDFLLTDIEHGVWRYRREPQVLRSTTRMSLTSAQGIPHLAPELVLLFKSKNTSGLDRAKDQADFEQACAALEPERRAWLRWALLATDPDHPWGQQI